MEFTEQITKFWIPIFFLMIVISALAWWLFCVFSKPRFSKKSSVYAGRIMLEKNENGDYFHQLVGFQRYPLKKYNTAGALLVPSMHPLEAQIQSVHFTATKNGPECNELYFVGSVFPMESERHWNCKEILNHVQKTNGALKIDELQHLSAASLKRQFLVRSERVCYVFPKKKTIDADGVTHIESATILFYD